MDHVISPAPIPVKKVFQTEIGWPVDSEIPEMSGSNPHSTIVQNMCISQALHHKTPQSLKADVFMTNWFFKK